MTFSDFFVSRPRFAVVLSVIIFIAAFRWPHPTSAVLIWLVILGLIGLVLIDFFGRVPAAKVRE